VDSKFNKIAVCLSGHMRTFLETSDILKRDFLDNVAESYDFFIYTTRRKDWRVGKGETLRPGPLLTDDELEFLYQTYDPKRIVIDEKDFDSVEGHSLDNNKRKTMLTRIKRADMLRREYSSDTGVEYDQVIRMRPDQLILTPFEDLSKIQPDKLAILPYGRVHNGYSDTFAMGPPSLIDVYCNICDHSDEYLEKPYWGHSTKIELLLMNYLKDRDIPTYFLEDLNILIKRIHGYIGDRNYWFQDQVKFKIPATGEQL